MFAIGIIILLICFLSLGMGRKLGGDPNEPIQDAAELGRVGCGLGFSVLSLLCFLVALGILLPLMPLPEPSGMLYLRTIA